MLVLNTAKMPRDSSLPYWPFLFTMNLSCQEASSAIVAMSHEGASIEHIDILDALQSAGATQIVARYSTCHDVRGWNVQPDRLASRVSKNNDIPIHSVPFPPANIQDF